MSPQGSALGLVVIKLSNIAHKNIYIIYRIVTSVLAWRETHCTEMNPLFRGLKFLPRENIKVMVSMPLFFSCFSTRIRFAVRKYSGCDYAVDRPVDGVESRFRCSPLL